MATTKAPLFGLDASGTLADSIVFSKWRGRTYVRRHAVPANPKSGLQVGVRSVMKFITQDYTNLTAAEKTSWSTLAAVDNITNLNAQVRDAISRARRNLGWRRDPTEAPATTPDAPTALTATAQPKTIVWSWTRPAANKGNYSAALYQSTTMGFTADISNLVAIVDEATITVTIPNLTTGTTYYARVRETNGDGDLGALAIEASGTPT